MTGKKSIKPKLSDIVYVAQSEIHGKGLFAKVRLKKDIFIGTYEGPIAKRNGSHVLWVYEDDDDEDSCVGRRGLNNLRYLNHSKKPNCWFNGFDLFTLKSIKPDAEMTFDYLW